MPEPILIPLERMTVEAYLAWAEKQPRGRFELVEGEVFAMTPERAAHLRAKLGCVVALQGAIAAAGLECEALTDGATVQIDAHTAFEPDASVSCGPRMDDEALILPNPVIVVEVVSRSSRRVDTSLKLRDYFRVPSIHHYLVLTTGRRSVVHYARQADGSVAIRIVPSGPLRLDPPGLTVQVEQLFGR